MAAGKLIVKKSSGELLYDTRNISYGLVKSGFLSYFDNWRRLRLRGVNVDPNIGSSWVNEGIPGDNQYGFTLDKPKSPIVFLVGKGVVTGVSVSGTAKTYLFAGATTETKYYCFDLMQDDSIKGASLKARDANGGLNFNSNQIPLNVVLAKTAPGPGPSDRFGRPVTTYDGGFNERISYQTTSASAIVHSVVDIALEAYAEYAAFLPWSRSCGVIDTNSMQGGSRSIYGVSEGAYGRVGGISFLFAPPGRTTHQDWSSNNQAEISYEALPVDRFPVALVIRTESLPFPFN